MSAVVKVNHLYLSQQSGLEKLGRKPHSVGELLSAKGDGAWAFVHSWQEAHIFPSMRMAMKVAEEFRSLKAKAIEVPDPTMNGTIQ